MYVCLGVLTPSSIIWFVSNGSDALWLLTMALAESKDSFTIGYMLSHQRKEYLKATISSGSDTCKTMGLPLLNHLIATLKLQSSGPSYSNTVIGTLVVDGWAVTFGTARRRLGGCYTGR